MSTPRTLIGRLRRPEYTGENRCLPCTVLNVALGVIAAAVVNRRDRRGAAVTLIAAIGVIYLRGYLVPGTPTLTQRYLPDEVLAAFGKQPESIEQDVPEEIRRVAAARMEGGHTDG